MNMCNESIEMNVYVVKFGYLVIYILIINLDKINLVFMDLAVFIWKLHHFKQKVFLYW